MKPSLGARVLAIFTLAICSTSQKALACDTPAYGNCLNGDGSLACCPDGQICQPWMPTIANCQPVSQECPRKLESGVGVTDLSLAFSWHDFGLTLGDCCNACSQSPRCAAFMFINYRAGAFVSRPSCFFFSVEAMRGLSTTPMAGSVFGQYVTAFVAEETANPPDTATPSTSEPVHNQTDSPQGTVAATVPDGCVGASCDPQNW